MSKIYYETSAFWNYFVKVFNKKEEIPEELEELSPLNGKSEKTTAPWTLDEFCHKFTKNQFKNLGRIEKLFKNRSIKKRTKILTQIPEFIAFFTQETVDTREINQLFITLYFLVRNENLLEKIHAKDLLHLAYAMHLKCDRFVTCDSGFLRLTNVDEIRELMKSCKLREIIIIDKNFRKIKEREHIF